MWSQAEGSLVVVSALWHLRNAWRQSETASLCGEVNGDWPFTCPVATAAGRMLAWDARGTRLPLGFTALRMQTNWLQCWAVARLPHTEPAAEGRCLNHPVHLLCRALRMAPACYRRFELAAAEHDAKVHILGGGTIHMDGKERTHRGTATTCRNLSKLASEMRRYAAAEGLSVHVLPDGCSIVVHRVGSSNALPAAAYVQ